MSDQRIVSPNGRAVFQVQDDGNVVLYLDDRPVWSTETAFPPPPPDPPAPPAHQIGMVTFDGRGFRQHGQYLNPVGVHAGDMALRWAEGREVEIHEDLADMRALSQALGTQVFARTWLSINWRVEHPFWAGRKLDPTNSHTRSRIVELLRIGAEDYGIMWHVALGDSVGLRRSEKYSYFAWLSDVVRHYPEWFLLVEGQNEVLGTADTWEHDPAEIERQVQIVRDDNPNHLYALSAAAGEGSELASELHRWTPDWMRTFYGHWFRGGHWGDQMRHMFSVTHEAAVRSHGFNGEGPGVNLRPYYNGHTGPGAWVSGMDHPMEWLDAPHRYGLYMAASLVFRQVPTFMCTHGVKREGRFKDVPGWQETIRLVHALPRDIMTFRRLFHGGNRYRGERVLAATHEVRVEHTIADDGRCVMVVYPNSGPVSPSLGLVVQRNWKGTLYTLYGAFAHELRIGLPRSFSSINDGLRLVGRLT